jgi:hypothetical protein
MYLRGGARYTVQQNPKAKSKVPDYNTFTMGIGQPYSRVDLNPIPESTLSPSQGIRIWPQGLYPASKGLRIWPLALSF